MAFKNRIIEYKRLRIGDLAVNPFNPRLHGEQQKKVLAAILDTFGQVQAIIAYYSERNNGKLTIFDGHNRQELDPDEEWWVAITDLNDAEVDQLVMAYDPISALADIALPTAVALPRSDDAALGEFFDYTIKMAGGTPANVPTRNRKPKENGEGVALPPPPPEPARAWEADLGKGYDLQPGQVWQVGSHRLEIGEITEDELWQISDFLQGWEDQFGEETVLSMNRLKGITEVEF